MKIHLKALDYEFDGLTLMEDETMQVNFGNINPGIFAPKAIYDEIIKAQEDGRLALKWLDKEEILENIAEIEKEEMLQLDLVTFKYTLSFAYMGDDVCSNSYLEFVLIPETVPEIECLIRMATNAVYEPRVRNSVLQFKPYTWLTDYNEPKLIGGYLIVHAYNQYNDERDHYGNRKIDDFWYSIRLIDLKREVVHIDAPEWMIKHLVGKGGVKINDFASELQHSGYPNVKKIQLHEYPKRAEGEQYVKGES